jgi:hypothetical protein
MIYEMTGAGFSHLAVRDGAAAVAVPLVFIGLITVSWALLGAERRHRFYPGRPARRHIAGQQRDDCEDPRH